MTRVTGRVCIALAVLGLLGGTAGRARAGLITYTESATASGSLGGTDFNNALVTFTQTADTADISGIEVPDQTSSVTIAGLGTVDITEATNTFSLGTFAGVERQFESSVILDASNPAISGYDLSTSFGPVTGNSTIIVGFAVATASGDLILTAAGDATFQAVAAVPEPATIVSASLACVMGLGCAWCRRKRSAA